MNAAPKAFPPCSLSEEIQKVDQLSDRVFQFAVLNEMCGDMEQHVFQRQDSHAADVDTVMAALAARGLALTMAATKTTRVTVRVDINAPN